MHRIINQVLIVVLGVGAVWYLTEATPEDMLLGCWLGLLSEPFWLYESYLTKSWGIAIMSVMYGAIYAKGILYG